MKERIQKILSSEGIASRRQAENLIREGKADGAKLHKDNIEQYRENQKKVIPNWVMPEYNW